MEKNSKSNPDGLPKKLRCFNFFSLSLSLALLPHDILQPYIISYGIHIIRAALFSDECCVLYMYNARVYHVCVYVCKCICTYMCICRCVYLCVCILYIHIYSYICVYIPDHRIICILSALSITPPPLPLHNVTDKKK